MATVSVSTTKKIRFPAEMLDCIEAWATERKMTRSKAVRVLLFRGLACDWGPWKCNCDPDQCSGACNG